jgi:chorismate mutase-like protein
VTREEALQALEEYRVSIDALDLRLLELLNERTQVVEQIGRVKRAAKLPIYEPRREEQVFENITTHNGGPLSPEAVKRIFERIIDEMRTIQRIRMQTGVETGTDGDL